MGAVLGWRTAAQGGGEVRWIQAGIAGGAAHLALGEMSERVLDLYDRAVGHSRYQLVQ